jgi:hypothetical protein
VILFPTVQSCVLLVTALTVNAQVTEPGADRAPAEIGSVASESKNFPAGCWSQETDKVVAGVGI